MTQKIPEQLEVVEVLPRNATFKILKHELVKQFSGGARRMRFVFNYPETSGLESDLLDSGEISDVAVAVEAAGFDAFALTEHPIPGANWLAHGGHQTLDPFVGLAFAAAVTERIKLLTHLSVAPYRNPFLLAKTAATLDRLSQGRFVLGLGTGYHKTEFFALGVDFDERNALFDEALELLPKAWAGEPFDAAGIHFTAKGVIQRPRPAQNPIPIWIGGNSKLSRRRAATVQGWMPMGIPEEVARTTRSPHIAGPRATGRDDHRGQGPGRRPRRRARLLHELHGGGHPPADRRHRSATSTSSGRWRPPASPTSTSATRPRRRS